MVHSSNAIDLDLVPRSQHRLNGGTRWEIVFEKFSIHVVHCIEVFYVSKKN
ncbi:MAG TPA: hypothetical protein VN860_04655 [Candidatus Acidoferrales bacterium]|nr:hypothetical protein [Candidatus Acidoferrales bacterium]